MPNMIGYKFLLTWAFAFVATGAASAGPGDAQKGQEIARDKCAACHAIGTEGTSPRAEAPPFRTFSRKWPVDNLEEALAEGISVGHGPMPEFVFEPAQIADLIAYLQTIQENPQ